MVKPKSTFTYKLIHLISVGGCSVKRFVLFYFKESNPDQLYQSYYKETYFFNPKVKCLTQSHTYSNKLLLNRVFLTYKPNLFN